MTPLDFIHGLTWDALPPAVQKQIKLCLMDLIGVGVAGRQTELSRIAHAYVQAEHPGQVPLPFDDATASATGAALAYGMTIDSIDAHDGFNPAKGHLGCPLWPAVYVNCAGQSGEALLTALAMGYEFGARCSIAQHGSVPDYHTSGSWGAVAAAAASARLMALSPDQTRHALGIAEYHGPRSQMMRVIDYPTMLKDGAGWGAMCGVSSARMAAMGFTGAPAILVEEQPEVWADLGQRWYILEQYFKPYPICRWAQAPVEAALALRAAHGLTAEEIDRITITTFHEAIRLAHPTPKTTEEAQYSTSFPVAAALVHGRLEAGHIMPDALQNPDVQRLSQAITMEEDPQANAAFPLRRKAKVTLHLRNGRDLQSDWTEPKWEHTAPPTEAELTAKFTAYATPVVGPARTEQIIAVNTDLETRPAADLLALMGPV
ncbi:MAG: MmgE/PrpD family protein [Pseudomonadota bacterium]